MITVYFCDLRVNNELSKIEQRSYIRSIICDSNSDVIVRDESIVQLIIDWTKNVDPVNALTKILKQINVKFPIKLSELSGEHNETFMCETADNKIMEVSLYFSHFFERCDEIHVKYDDKTVRYIYSVKNVELKLQSKRIERDGIKLLSYYSEYFCNRTLILPDERKIVLDVKEPESGNEENIQVLYNADAIEEYLLNFAVTPNILFYECYKKIKDELYQFSDETMKLISEFRFEISKKVNEKKSDILDAIVLNNGMLQQYVRTISGETILWNRNGTWSYRLENEYNILCDNNPALVSFVSENDQEPCNANNLIHAARREVFKSVMDLLL